MRLGEKSKQRILAWLPLGVIPLVVLFLFGRAVGYQFTTFDDGIHVFDNPLLHPPSWAHFIQAWCHPFLGLYIPVTYSLWSLVAAISTFWVPPFHGELLHPALFHGVNVSLHAVNAILVYVILRHLIANSTWAPALGALFFACHPLQVESVAWCSALKDVLAGTFSLVGIWQYLIFSELSESHASEGSEKARVGRANNAYWLSFLAFCFALLSKPAAVTLPLLLAVLEIGWRKVPWRVSLRRWGWWCGLAVLVVGVTKTQQPNGVIPFVTPVLSRFWVAADALTFYLSKLFFPLVLTLNYGRSPQYVLSRPETYWLALIPFLFILILGRRRDRRVWLAASLLFLCSLLPVLGWIPFYYQTYSTVADRFVYLGMLGPALAISWIFARPTRVKILIGVVCFSWLGAKTLVQLHYWENNQSLVEHIAVWNHEDPDIQYSLGVMAAEASQPPGPPSYYGILLRLPPPSSDPRERAKKYDEAIYHYEQALRLNPRHAPAHNNLGLLLCQHGLWSDAAKHFRAAVELEPRLAQASNNLGVALAHQADYDGAIASFKNALHYFPQDESAHVNLGLALSQKRNWDGASAEFIHTLRINPANAVARVKLAELEATQRGKKIK